MFARQCVIATLAFLHLSSATSLPDYITACSRSDPRIDECMVEHANEALPHVLKGDAKFNIPNLQPLRVPEIGIRSQGGLNMTFTNCTLHGLESTVVRRMHVDFEARTTTIEVHIDRLQVLADYDIAGRILVLPIVGRGPANVTIVDGAYVYSFGYELARRKDGERHVRFARRDLEFRATRIHLRLDNLFGGDRALGDGMNRFLDDNWRAVTDELYPSLKEAVAAIVTSIASGLFSKVPFDDLFLP